MTRMITRTMLSLAALAAFACEETPEVSFYKDVQPILNNSCVRCHSPGNVAPFSLETFEDALAFKEAIVVSVENRTMPPFLADSECEDYVANPQLSDEQIALIAKWVDDGAPEGDPINGQNIERQAVEAEFELDRIDLSMDMPDTFTPAGEGAADEYRCFPMAWPEATDKFAVGFGVRPGEARLVHHVIAYVAPPNRAEEVRQLDEADPRPGYECFGGPGFGGFPRWLGAWAPGSPAVVYPEGTGLRMEAGSTVVLQMHYYTTGNENLTDQSGIDIKLEDSVEAEAFIVPFTNPLWLAENGMSIPAGDSNVLHSFRVRAGEMIDQPFMMYSANAHMHRLGKSEVIWLEDGETGEVDCLLDIPEWDFDWQLSYGFQEPKLVEPNDFLGLECSWDNSAPGAVDSQWGDGTGDEMCLAIFYIAPM